MMHLQRLLLGDDTPAILVVGEDGHRLLVAEGDQVISTPLEFQGGIQSALATSLEYHDAFGLGFLRGQAKGLPNAFLCGEWTNGEWLVADLTDTVLALTAPSIACLGFNVEVARSIGWRFYDGSAPGGTPAAADATDRGLAELERTVAAFFGGLAPDEATVAQHRRLIEATRPPLPTGASPQLGPIVHAVVATTYGDDSSHTRLVAVTGDRAAADDLAAKAQEAADQLSARYGYGDDPGWPSRANPFDPSAGGHAHYAVVDTPTLAGE